MLVRFDAGVGNGFAFVGGSFGVPRHIVSRPNSATKVRGNAGGVAVAAPALCGADPLLLQPESLRARLPCRFALLQGALCVGPASVRLNALLPAVRGF